MKFLITATEDDDFIKEEIEKLSMLEFELSKPRRDKKIRYTLKEGQELVFKTIKDLTDFVDKATMEIIIKRCDFPHIELTGVYLKGYEIELYNGYRE